MDYEKMAREFPFPKCVEEDGTTSMVCAVLGIDRLADAFRWFHEQMQKETCETCETCGAWEYLYDDQYHKRVGVCHSDKAQENGSINRTQSTFGCIYHEVKK